MTCLPCNGSGLKNDRLVCPICKGLGDDGIPNGTVAAAESPEVVEKPKKVIVKKKK